MSDGLYKSFIPFLLTYILLLNTFNFRDGAGGITYYGIRIVGAYIG